MNQRQRTGSTGHHPIPYRFDEVHPEQATLDAPMWRDGGAGETRFSGELLLNLEALTPLFVGNHQRKLGEKHSLLLPQMLDDGRVILGASSLKGMLRATLASLLDAPMERVTEHHYTYRPNLGFGSQKEPCPAIVEKVEGDDEQAQITIKLLPKGSSVVFVRDEAVQKLGQAATGSRITREVNDVRITGNAPRQRLERERGPGRTQRLDHYLYSYVGGTDGEGKLAKAINPKSGVYQRVLITTEQVAKATPMTIPARVYQAYWRTQEILADDKIGHLAPGHPLTSKVEDLGSLKRTILENAKLSVNQLIYVEIEHGVTPTGKRGVRITSMGHHFHYRWAYTSSVRYQDRLSDGKGTLREVLAPRPEEVCDEQGAPQRLSAARLLFGYTLDEGYGLAGLAKGNYKRLAGRIAFNHAIEAPGDKTPQQRFVKGEDELTLQVLGMPRPSAVEFYLKQPALPDKLTTYGDLPGDAGGELAGRKFYHHQSDAARNATVYEAEYNASNPQAEERGSRVRFVSAPGSRFLCTLRFDSLRPWELGTLLAALEPQRIANRFCLASAPNGYAHKLGYAKPLGLGSVRLTIDAARWHKDDDWQWQNSRSSSDSWQELQALAICAFEEKLRHSWKNDEQKLEGKLESWLKSRAWSDLGRTAYPMESNNKGEISIYQFHTNLRREHGKQRRGGKARFDGLTKLLERNQ